MNQSQDSAIQGPNSVLCVGGVWGDSDFSVVWEQLQLEEKIRHGDRGEKICQAVQIRHLTKRLGYDLVDKDLVGCRRILQIL